MFLGRLLIELGGFALLNGYSVFGTMPETRAKPVTVDFAYQFRLAVDYLYGALGAGGDTLAAPVAFFFIDYDDVS